MAAVYAAKHEIGRKEAIKILHPEVAKDKELVARFKREAHAVNQFSHPGAVEIRDIDTSEDGEPFLVMELLEGESLARRLKKEGVELDEGLRLIDELLDVLVAAHAEGVIHRDIKPSNLFIEPNGKLKVLDFGVARLKHAPGTLITDAGTTLGTIAYMPPEQLRGEEIDRRADIYAAGATLFRIVAGERVHTGGEDEVAAKVLKGPARTLVDVVPDASIGVQKVVDRALAHLVERRYPDARTMQLDVRALIDGEPPPYATTKLQAGDDPRSREPLDDGAEPGEDAKPGDDAELPDGSQPVEDTEPDSEGMTAKKVAKTIVDTGDDADVTTDDDAPTVKRASTKSKKRKKRKSKSEVDLEAPTVVRKKKKRGAKNDKPGKTEIADDDDLAPTRVRKRKPASAVAEEAPRSLSHLEEEKSGKGLIWLVAVILIGVVVVYVMRDRGEETTATKTDPPITKSVAKTLRRRSAVCDDHSALRRTRAGSVHGAIDGSVGRAVELDRAGAAAAVHPAAGRSAAQAASTPRVPLGVSHRLANGDSKLAAVATADPVCAPSQAADPTTSATPAAFTRTPQRQSLSRVIPHDIRTGNRGDRLHWKRARSCAVESWRSGHSVVAQPAQSAQPGAARRARRRVVAQ